MAENSVPAPPKKRRSNGMFFSSGYSMIIDVLIFFLFVAIIFGVGLLFTYATRKKRHRTREKMDEGK